MHVAPKPCSDTAIHDSHDMCPGLSGTYSSSLEVWHTPGEARVCSEVAPHRHNDGYIAWVMRDATRRLSPTGGAKDNADKPRVDLLPMKAVEAMARVLGYGAVKYRPHNWRRGLSWSETMASATRHLMRFQDGENLDPESGQPHLAMAMCQVAFLTEFYLTDTGTDDRFAALPPEESEA